MKEQLKPVSGSEGTWSGSSIKLALFSFLLVMTIRDRHGAEDLSRLITFTRATGPKTLPLQSIAGPQPVSRSSLDCLSHLEVRR